LFLKHPRRRISLGFFAIAQCVCHNAHGLVSSYGGTNVFNGVYINQAIGANSFYQDGFFGRKATGENIEAGLVWNGNESLLGRVT